MIEDSFFNRNLDFWANFNVGHSADKLNRSWDSVDEMKSLSVSQNIMSSEKGFKTPVFVGQVAQHVSL